MNYSQLKVKKANEIAGNLDGVMHLQITRAGGKSLFHFPPGFVYPLAAREGRISGQDREKGLFYICWKGVPMSHRKPLVIGSDGKLQQIQPGDVLDATLLPQPPGPGPVGSVFSAENKDLPIMPAGAPVAMHTSGIGVVLASAIDGTRPGVGLMQTSVLTSFAGLVQVAGLFTLADWTLITGVPALLPRATYFLDIVSGKLTTFPPTFAGQILQIAGESVSLDTMDLHFEPFILL